MGALIRGHVVVTQFPFSGSSEFKKRPCLVLATWPFGRGTDALVCMITSQATSDPGALAVEESDFVWGSLRIHRCYLRPTYLAALDEAVLGSPVGALKDETVSAAIDRVKAVLN